MLLTKFNTSIAAFNLKKGEKILCAISGGMDSMCLLHLFQQTGIEVVIAHMNFGLRGQASDADEKFIREYALENKLEFHSKKVFKAAHAKNTQVWAREERYSFFHELLHKGVADYMAVAHHQDDQIETILLSVFKGYEVQSIQSKNGKIIRPLLDSSKAEIKEYVADVRLLFREDQSNQSIDYDRNFIRLELTPTIKDRFPHFNVRLTKFAERQKKIKRNYEILCESLVTPAITEKSIEGSSLKVIKIDKSLINERAGMIAVIGYLQKEFRFSETQVQNLLERNNVCRLLLKTK